MWAIETTDTFDLWFDALSDLDRENVIAGMLMLKAKGPLLPRPYADTVNHSHYTNMKELRVQSQGSPLRIFFAFDLNRTGILLCAGNKTGNEKRFYREMISIADKEFAIHIERLKKK